MSSQRSPERDLSRLVASKLKARGGALLCQRRGSLNPQDQTVGRYGGRAPERRGIWAFPFPYNDDFFNYHKWDEIIPKHLSRVAIEAVVEAEEHLSDEQSTTSALWAERDTWIDAHSGQLPVRRFWWEGDVWARFDRRGETIMAPREPGDSGRSLKMDWEIMTMGEYLRAARRAEPYGLWTHDHMEIFLAPTRGHIIGS